MAAVNPAASVIGLEPQLGLADALARFPQLLVADMNEAADKCLLDHLSHCALACSPMVMADGNDGLILDISGVAHLFGSEAQLIESVQRRLSLGGRLTVLAACAGHPDTAHAIVRWGNPHLPEAEAIDALPIAALELHDDDIRALQRAGLNSVSMMKTRSAASIAARFGANTVRALRRLYGEEARPLIPVVPVTELSAERRFADPIALIEDILAICDDMMRELALKLAAEHLGGRAFTLSLFRSDGDVRVLEIATSLATRDPAVIRRLFEERLDSLADPLNPGFGYDMLRLGIADTAPLPPQQIEGSGKIRAEDSIAALIDRLSIRHGADIVRWLVPCNSHMPERAQKALPVFRQHPEHVHAVPAWSGPCADAPPTRPLWLLDPPDLLDVLAEVPDGPPRLFRWRGQRHEVALAEGPERIAGEWWRAEQGHWPGHGAPEQAERTRDYYRIEVRAGHRLWLFRAGLYGDDGDIRTPAWYLHGLFA